MKPIALILPLFLSLLHPALAGSVPKEEVSADAKWLLHLEATQFRASKVGSYIITWPTTSFPTNCARPCLQKRPPGTEPAGIRV
jgi:hypothetical protein